MQELAAVSEPQLGAVSIGGRQGLVQVAGVGGTHMAEGLLHTGVQQTFSHAAPAGASGASARLGSGPRATWLGGWASRCDLRQYRLLA